jgi:hypothetical protein
MKTGENGLYEKYLVAFFKQLWWERVYNRQTTGGDDALQS